MSKLQIHHALRNWLENGVLLGAAATLSLAIFQGYVFSGAAARYVAFWIVLPAAWFVAFAFTRVAREFVLARYEDLGSTRRRVVAGGAVAAAFIAYGTIITSNIPEPLPRRQAHPVTSTGPLSSPVGSIELPKEGVLPPAAKRESSSARSRLAEL